ncbi:MAG: hypothetical protein AAFN43_11710 [Pseudomonadota bacterium]
MRILALALMAGSAVLAANPLQEPQKNEAPAYPETSAAIGVEVDRIITGQTISGDEIKEWEEQRRRYLECPDCIAVQPFPGE